VVFGFFLARGLFLRNKKDKKATPTVLLFDCQTPAGNSRKSGLPSQLSRNVFFLFVLKNKKL